MNTGRKSAVTVSSCNPRKRERAAGDTSGSADQCGRVRRDRIGSRAKIQYGAHEHTRRKAPRPKGLPLFWATVAFGQDSASERLSSSRSYLTTNWIKRSFIIG